MSNVNSAMIAMRAVEGVDDTGTVKFEKRNAVIKVDLPHILLMYG
jgi:hypothetical protein